MKKKIVRKKVKSRPELVKAASTKRAEIDESISEKTGQTERAFGSIKEKIQKGSHVVGHVMQMMGRRLKGYSI